jgi:uncharacterized beta-barrel protein YwiB (DUF1934 family)
LPDKNVILSIVAEQTLPSGETNRMEMITEGRMYLENDATCLEYEESESSGMGGSKTMVMVSGRLVSIIRQGVATTHMVFSEGKKSYNIYRTPVGSMEMGIWPTGMQIDIGEEIGEITLEYELEVAGQFTGSNMICISYRLKKA